MARPAVVTKQNDFSAGEIDSVLRRSDDLPVVKAGARQMSNWRILNSRGVQNRSGRRVLFIDGPRVDEVLMSPGNLFYLVFGSTGYLRVYDSTGTKVFDSGAVLSWNASTVQNIVWDIYQMSIYITLPGLQPRILTWDGASTWTLATYDAETLGTQKRNIFYRLSPLGITLLPSAQSGNITLTFSSAVLVAGHVNTYLRYVNRQLKITAVNSSTSANATVTDAYLNSAQDLSAAGSWLTAGFTVGQAVIGKTSGATGIVVSVTAADLVVQLTNSIGFTNPETVVGPGGSNVINGVANLGPQAVTDWDDEVMNSFRGWPASCFVDQGRLGLCDFPGLPGLVAWSALADFKDLYTDASNAGPTNAIQELVPGKSRVRYVVPGMDGSEFVFCDNAIYYIPISVSNPLKPGSVAFNQLTGDGSAAVKPRLAQQSIVFVNASTTQIKAVQAIGAYGRPYIVDDISQFHLHLINTPIAIAIPTGSGQYEERYIYILNTDGTVMVGKYGLKNGLIEPMIGWLPWTPSSDTITGNSVVKWVSARDSDVLFGTTYSNPSVTTVSELVDDTTYLDAAMAVNPPPTALQQTQPAGTPVGNMTADGGLADAFNGTRVQAQASSAGIAAADGYVGLHFTVAQVVGQALVWPASNAGFATGGSGTITFELRGKQTAPSSSTDGTLLATVTRNVNQTTGPIVIDQPYSTTTWAYAWVHIARTGSTHLNIAQLLLQTAPLWWFANGKVTLMDQTTRMMGTYTLDSHGNIIPQGNAGEDLTSLTLVAGLAWTATLEPFIPAAGAGQDIGQRMWPRRLQRLQIYVANSTGFVMARLYSDESGSQLPAAATIMKQRRIPTWNADDDPTKAPPLREQSYLDRPLGRSHDPRWSLIKDTPGPLAVLELSAEVTT